MYNEVKDDLKKLIEVTEEIQRKADDAASQASYVDTNTMATNEKLDRIIELLEEIVNK